jgi:sulfur relay (sulfurtransferase) complex TusBCD TusD component (DsrE family)
MLRKLLAALAVFVVALAATPAPADTQGSLFINLTSDEPHRVDMALVFAKSMLERAHPVTIWLNDRGVFVASQVQAGTFAEQQKMLAELTAKGASVIVCPFCMKHYGVKDTDLVSTAKVSNPDLTAGLLFKEGSRTLTW